MEALQTQAPPIPKTPLAWVIANTLTLFVPFTALAYVGFQLITNQFSGLQLGLFIGFLILTLLGTGLGYHRYFSHHSFKANRGLKILLGVLGSAGGLGPICWWTAIHRQHHRFTDGHKDPHTPHLEGSGLLQNLKNIWMASFGFTYNYSIHGLFMAYPEKDTHGYSKEFRASVQDLMKDSDIRRIDRNYVVSLLAFILIPGLLMFAITGVASDIWQGALWGGLARISANQCIFAFINNIGHRFGPQPFDSNDESRNLYWFAIFSNGESLHNNHHAFPASAKAGMEWWQIDLNYYFLAAFVKMGWATQVRVPSVTELSRKRKQSGQK
ncbi:MAG: fatty acid desaturase [Bdellovibrionota bacterium]